MPPYGDGTAPVDDESVLVMLSPPYGDGTIMDIEQIMAAMFSPPYGDKLQYQMLCLKTVNKGFSPPYGENPLSHGLRRASSPEGGAYRRVTAAVKALPSGELARSA